MVKSKDGQNEIISIKELKWRNHRDEFLKMIGSFETQIEFAKNSVEYCNKKIKELKSK